MQDYQVPAPMPVLEKNETEGRQDQKYKARGFEGLTFNY